MARKGCRTVMSKTNNALDEHSITGERDTGIIAVHHFAIIVSSEASVEFYTQLGFKETYRRNRKYDTVVLLNGYGVQIEMFVDANHPDRATSPENIGLRHLALRVRTIEDTVDKLRSSGLAFEVGPIESDWVGERFCFITDPDGVPIELHE